MLHVAPINFGQNLNIQNINSFFRSISEDLTDNNILIAYNIYLNFIGHEFDWKQLELSHKTLQYVDPEICYQLAKRNPAFANKLFSLKFQDLAKLRKDPENYQPDYIHAMYLNTKGKIINNTYFWHYNHHKNRTTEFALDNYQNINLPEDFWQQHKITVENLLQFDIGKLKTLVTQQQELYDQFMALSINETYLDPEKTVSARSLHELAYKNPEYSKQLDYPKIIDLQKLQYRLNQFKNHALP